MKSVKILGALFLSFSMLCSFVLCFGRLVTG